MLSITSAKALQRSPAREEGSDEQRPNALPNLGLTQSSLPGGWCKKSCWTTRAQMSMPEKRVNVIPAPQRARVCESLAVSTWCGSMGGKTHADRHALVVKEESESRRGDDS